MARAIKFYRWSDRRKAKFVEYRLLGMHTHWAVFWALVDRNGYQASEGHSCFEEELVEEIAQKKEEWPWEAWVKPMGEHDLKNLPPKSRFDALEKGGE